VWVALWVVDWHVLGPCDQAALVPRSEVKIKLGSSEMLPGYKVACIDGWKPCGKDG
jgi:hypothetical protein